MSYSRIAFPRGVRSIRLRFEPLSAYLGSALACAKQGDTWFVWDRKSLLVVAIFHMSPNVHGWWPAKAHAECMVRRGDPVDIAALDAIP